MFYGMIDGFSAKTRGRNELCHFHFSFPSPFFLIFTIFAEIARRRWCRWWLVSAPMHVILDTLVDRPLKPMHSTFHCPIPRTTIQTRPCCWKTSFSFKNQLFSLFSLGWTTCCCFYACTQGTMKRTPSGLSNALFFSATGFLHVFSLHMLDNVFTSWKSDLTRKKILSKMAQPSRQYELPR